MDFHKWVEPYIFLEVRLFNTKKLIFLASNGLITTSSFVNNIASEKGGAIFITGFNQFKLVSTTFNKNQAEVEGSEIYATQSSLNITIENVQISNVNSLNSIYLENVGFNARTLNIRSNLISFNFSQDLANHLNYMILEVLYQAMTSRIFTFQILLSKIQKLRLEEHYHWTRLLLAKTSKPILQ